MSSEEDFKSILRLFVGAIKDEIETVEASNSIEKSRIPYRRVKTKFTYDSNNGSISQAGLSYEDFIRLEWSVGDRYQIVELVEKSQKYQELYKKLKLVIRQAYPKLDIDHVRLALQHTCTATTERMIKLGVSKETLDDHLNAFVSNLYDNLLNVFMPALTGEPFKVHWKMWVEGVSLEEDAYDIFDGLKIRRTVPSDLETEESLQEFMSRVWMPQPWTIIPPPVIIEYSYLQERNVEIGRKQEALLDCLRLFDLGSLFSVKNETIPKSANPFFPDIRLPTRPTAPVFKYRICGEDIPRLGTFIRAVENVLPESCSSFDPNVTPECISLLRYKDALFKGENSEARITSAIMCLEALYLRENNELSRRLRQRGATVLGLLGLDALFVSEKLGDAYEVRSSYVHGSAPRKEVRNKYNRDFQALARETLDYARCSLIICLVARKSLNVTKEQLIKLIDDSLLDDKSREELKKIICAACTMRRQDGTEMPKEEAESIEPHGNNLKTCFLDDIPFKIPIE
jgi:hypothetical protein